ncbi:hypothetical protein J2Z66_001928 [Paenibacillus eucommiae]|uniref:Uncharacterized protein n=1 Tax=Paenibacillus eucommiae TaxID=1355755 RepID=A0ABS4IRY6_9BACL|nr:hypothetical protein [Paenibacillus eucommiae]
MKIDCSYAIGRSFFYHKRKFKFLNPPRGSERKRRFPYRHYPFLSESNLYWQSNERVLHLTMFFIVKTSVPDQSVTLMMIFIVKRGHMASLGGKKGL